MFILPVLLIFSIVGRTEDGAKLGPNTRHGPQKNFDLTRSGIGRNQDLPDQGSFVRRN